MRPQLAIDSLRRQVAGIRAEEFAQRLNTAGKSLGPAEVFLAAVFFFLAVPAAGMMPASIAPEITNTNSITVRAKDELQRSPIFRRAACRRSRRHTAEARLFGGLERSDKKK